MSETQTSPADLFTEMLRIQGEAARQMMAGAVPGEAAFAEWGEAAAKLQQQWLDFHEHQAVPAKYGIMSIPTLIVFKNGQVADQIVGAAPKAKIDQMLQRQLAPAA
jgi:thiol-disulfide isomerase/thioredoxin